MRLLNKKPPPHCPYPRSQQGITLIELMIALVIGLLATGAMLKVYVDSTRLYRFNESLARIQENGRFGLEFIRRDARMAGFWGCNHDVTPTNRIEGNLGVVPLYPDFVLSGISGENGTGSNADSITFSGAGRSVGMLNRNMDTSASGPDGKFRVNSTEKIKEDAALLITDCTTTDIFYVTKAGAGSNNRKLWHDTPENTSDLLSKAYVKESKLYRVQQTTFCIVPDADPVQRSLRRIVNQEDDETCLDDGDELVEGIENMQILMGEDTDGDGSVNRYCPPLPSVVCKGLDMDRVVSVRISLLAISPYNNVTTEPSPYFFNGAMVDVVDPDDRYLRKEFTTTVALRNKNSIRNTTSPHTTSPLPTVKVNACFAPTGSGAIKWKERNNYQLVFDGSVAPAVGAKPTACWSDYYEDWLVGCNTASTAGSVNVKQVGTDIISNSAKGDFYTVQTYADQAICSHADATGNRKKSKPFCKDDGGVMVLDRNECFHGCPSSCKYGSEPWFSECNRDEFLGDVTQKNIVGTMGGVGYKCCGDPDDPSSPGWRPGCQEYLDEVQGDPVRFGN